FSFIRLEEKLKSMGIHMFLPTMTQYEERTKVNLNDFGEKYGVNVPKSKVIHDLNSIHTLESEFSFPMIVKGKFYDASIAYNVEQLRSHFNKISAKWGLPIIIQEFIHGAEFNVTGLGDGTGRTIAAVPMRKQYITDKGKAWGGISIADEKMLEMTRKFLKNTKWRGGFELELMKDKDSKLFLLEINPRLPAWIYLAVGVGQNIPEALVNLAIGVKVKPFPTYTVGKMFIRYSWDMIVDREEFEQISIYGEL
ncbi:MAG: ATP-grasp domain-containing protein, partial [Bacteroidota bacterium]